MMFQGIIFLEPKVEGYFHHDSIIIVTNMEFQEGCQGNRRLWDRFCPFIMHPDRDFHLASHTWLSEVSL